MNRILVVGSVNMDIVIHMKAMPQPGETVLANEAAYNPGGKGANQAAGIGRLGHPVTMLGAVGTDANAGTLLSALKESGVDTSSIQAVDGVTGLAVISIDSSGQNQIIVVPGANGKLSVEAVEKHKALIDECQLVLLQCEIPMETVEYVAALAKQSGKTVILNPAPAPSSMPAELLAAVDLLTPNETELEILSGVKVTDMASAQKAAQSLIARGVKTIVVTMGKLGALVVTSEGAASSPCYDYGKVVDTTAAGDCFNAALTVKLACGATIEQAVQYANMAASIAVTRHGAIPSLPWKKEVDQALSELNT